MLGSSVVGVGLCSWLLLLRLRAWTQPFWQAGNEQLDKVAKLSAGRRVWVLFFLLLMSFVLLFLHYYND